MIAAPFHRFAPVMFLVACFSGLMNAQQTCQDGIVRLPSNVNGRITICSTISAVMPNLQKQLNAVLKNQADEAADRRQLTRLVSNLNTVGKNVDSSHQAELLRNLSAQLALSGADGGSEMKQEIAGLADKLDRLNNMISANLTNPQTKVQTQQALSGGVGDAISQLNTEKAESLLRSIDAQLKDIHKQTTDIESILQKQQAEESQRKQDALNAQARASAEKQVNPNTFALISAMSASHTLLLYVAHPGEQFGVVQAPFQDPTLRVVFRDVSGHAHLVAASDRQLTTPELWRIETPSYGTSIAVCFSADDPEQSQVRREVTQRFKVLPAQSYRTPIVPDGKPSLSKEDSLACDGVTTANTALAIVTDPSRDNTMPAPPSGEELMKRYAVNNPQYVYPDGSPKMVLTSANFYATRQGAGWSIVLDASIGLTAFIDTRIDLVVPDGQGTKTYTSSVPAPIHNLIKIATPAIPQLGRKLTICVSANNSGWKARQRWRQDFSPAPSAAGSVVTLQAVAQPEVSIDDGAPCR